MVSSVAFRENKPSLIKTSFLYLPLKKIKGKGKRKSDQSQSVIVNLVISSYQVFRKINKHAK